MKTLCCTLALLTACLTGIAFLLLSVATTDASWTECTCVTVAGEACYPDYNEVACRGYLESVVKTDPTVVAGWIGVLFFVVVVPVICCLNCCGSAGHVEGHDMIEGRVFPARVTMFVALCGVVVVGLAVARPARDDLDGSVNGTFAAATAWVGTAQAEVDRAAAVAKDAPARFVTEQMKSITSTPPSMKLRIDNIRRRARQELDNVRTDDIDALRRDYDDIPLNTVTFYIFVGLCVVGSIALLLALAPFRLLHHAWAPLLFLCGITACLLALLGGVGSHIVGSACDDYDNTKATVLRAFAARVPIGCAAAGTAAPSTDGVGTLITLGDAWMYEAADTVCRAACPSKDDCVAFYKHVSTCSYDTMPALLAFPPNNPGEGWPEAKTILKQDVPTLDGIVGDTLDPIGRCLFVNDLLDALNPSLCDDSGVGGSFADLATSCLLWAVCFGTLMMVLFAGSKAFHDLPPYRGGYAGLPGGDAARRRNGNAHPQPPRRDDTDAEDLEAGLTYGAYAPGRATHIYTTPSYGTDAYRPPASAPPVSAYPGPPSEYPAVAAYPEPSAPPQSPPRCDA